MAVILYKANLALNFWTRSFSGIGYWMDQVPSCHSPRKGATPLCSFLLGERNAKALSHHRPVGAGSMKVLLRALAGDWRNCRPLYFPRLPAVSPSNPSKYTVYCTLLINPMESLPHAVQRPYRMSLQMEYFLVHEYHTEYHQFRVE